MRPMEPRTVQLAPLSIRADIPPRSVNDEDRSIDLIFTTGAGVRRMDYWTGKEYVEKLSLDPAHVRLERLNEGAPVLDSHANFSVADILGAVVPGSASLQKKAGLARVRFSMREAVGPIWEDVRSGIIRSVSIGYRVYKYEEETPGKNALPVRTAVDWEPFEISMVPIPADAGARVRSGQSADGNDCEILPANLQPPLAAPTEPAVAARSAQPVTPPKEKKMDDHRSETIVEGNPLPQPPAPAVPAEPNERDAGVAQERERVQGIHTACRAARLPVSFEEKLVADGVALVDAQRRVFEELARRDVNAPSATSRQDVRVGDDPLVHVRSGIEEAILNRLYPRPSGSDKLGFELTDKGRPYRGMSLLRTAEAFLSARGIRTTGMSKMELAGLALGLDTRGGMHTTSDFALLLADVTGKVLRQAYSEAPQTFGPISRQVTLPDFKEAKRLQLGEAPALEEILEHGEYKSGSIGEGQEKFQLKSYGKKFAITRKALVNDDTDAFSRVPMLFGRAARNLESDLVWTQITANAAMADGITLFHASHGNLAGAGAAISIDTIGAGRAAMRKQTGLDAQTLLNIFPAYLIVPAAKETIADQFVSVNLVASAAGSINPFAGRLQVIAEPRLDANSLTAWYLAATPSQIDIIEYAYLEGESGPRVESRVGFDVDGLEVKCGHDFAAKVIDHRGLYKNAGA